MIQLVEIENFVVLRGLFIHVEIQTLIQINRQRWKYTWHEIDKYAQKGFSNDKIIDKETIDLIFQLPNKKHENCRRPGVFMMIYLQRMTKKEYKVED